MKFSSHPPFNRKSLNRLARLQRNLYLLEAEILLLKMQIRCHQNYRVLRAWFDGIFIAGLLAFLVFVIYGALFGMPHSSNEAPGISIILLRWLWPVFMLYLFVEPLLRAQAQKHWHHFKAIRLSTIACNFLVLVAVALSGYYLSVTFPLLNGSWLHLLPISQNGEATNLAAAPMQLPWVGPIFFVLFLLNIPYFASMEESLFRKGTRSWPDALLRSLAFGLVHCIMGVTVAMGLALSIGGLWFSWNYFRGGEERSTLHHATYNLIAIGLFALAVLISALL